MNHLRLLAWLLAPAAYRQLWAQLAKALQVQQLLK
jgi:hypothetical protein